jgi:hypothetical protein
LLHVGHLEPRKNLAIVMRALATLPQAERPELWLVGNDAGDRSRLEALATRLQCRPFVHMLGVVPDRELDALYDHARAVVVPSCYEGFGLCALEGLAHGRAVLASRAAALPRCSGPPAVCCRRTKSGPGPWPLPQPRATTRRLPHGGAPRPHASAGQRRPAAS